MANIDDFWRKAVEFTQGAEETTDEEVRIFFYCLRDSWIAADNRAEMIEASRRSGADACRFREPDDRHPALALMHGVAAPAPRAATSPDPQHVGGHSL
jgi:hypothetical protein